MYYKVLKHSDFKHIVCRVRYLVKIDSQNHAHTVEVNYT